MKGRDICVLVKVKGAVCKDEALRFDMGRIDENCGRKVQELMRIIGSVPCVWSLRSARCNVSRFTGQPRRQRSAVGPAAAEDHPIIQAGRSHFRGFRGVESFDISCEDEGIGWVSRNQIRFRWRNHEKPDARTSMTKPTNQMLLVQDLRKPTSQIKSPPKF